MKRMLFWMVALSLVAAPAAAQFQQMVEMHVKPGHEIAFENYVKKVIEAADKVGSPQGWSTFSVAVGKPGPTYRIGLPFQKWSERDGWHSVRGMLVQAFGEQEGSKIFSEGGMHIGSMSTRVWEMIPEGSANPPSVNSEPATQYDVTIRYIKPEMVAEYQGLLRRYKSAYEAADGKPSVARWVLRFGEGQNTTFRRTQSFESWAERDKWSAPELINAQFGPDAPLLFERLNAAVWKSEHFVSVYRPELSRTAPASTSDE